MQWESENTFFPAIAKVQTSLKKTLKNFFSQLLRPSFQRMKFPLYNKSLEIALQFVSQHFIKLRTLGSNNETSRNFN